MDATKSQSMRTRLSRRGALRAAGAGGAMAGAALAIASTARTRAEAGQQLTGSWMFGAVPPGGAAPAARFLASFTVDGLVIRTGPIRQAAPAALGVASLIVGTTHGEWLRTGDRQFSVSVVGFAFDEGGSFVATQRIRATITLDETLNSFNAISSVQFVQPDGTIVEGGTAPVVGTRIAIEPLA